MCRSVTLALFFTLTVGDAMDCRTAKVHLSSVDGFVLGVSVVHSSPELMLLCEPEIFSVRLLHYLQHLIFDTVGKLSNSVTWGWAGHCIVEGELMQQELW